EREQAPPRIPCAGGDLVPPQDHEPVRHDQHEATDETPHLGEYGKNKVSVALREERELALRSAAHTLPKELSGTDGDFRLDDIVGRPEGIPERVEVHQQPVLLIRL